MAGSLCEGLSLLLVAACTSAAASGEVSIVPEGLSVSALAGGNGVLEVTALTLSRGPSGTEVYAALRNQGDVPACHAAFAIELFDRQEQSLAAGITGLLTQHFYRLTDGSGSVAACVGPGDLTMAAVTDLPTDFAVEDVGYIIYRSPYFALDVAPIAGLSVRDLKSRAESGGARYSGALVNQLEVAVSRPAVDVYQLSAAGRPLGVVSAHGERQLPPGQSWTFETEVSPLSAARFVAFPEGALEMVTPSPAPSQP
jgi:hypothetical protein